MNKKTIKLIYIVLILIFFIYLFLQLFSFISATKIEVYNFQESSQANTNKATFLLTGKVTNIKQVFILGKEVFLNQNLEFKKNIFLFEGLNEILIKGITEKGKIIKKKITIWRTLK